MWHSVGTTRRPPPRAERKRNRIPIFLLIDRRLHPGPSRRPRGGYLLQLAILRYRKIKTALGSVESHRRLRLVLDLIFFTDNHLRARLLKNHHLGRNVDLLGVLFPFVNIHLSRAVASRDVAGGIE